MKPPVVIRPQTAADRAAVRGVLTAAFGRPVVADLSEALHQARAGAEGLCFVAELAGDVVGQVQLTRSWLDAPRALVEVLVLSPLAVAPRHQNRGIGGALVEHALQVAATAGPPLVFLEGSPSYYSRFGFTAAARLGFTAPSVRIPEGAFQVVRLPSYEPWMTGAVVYAEEFWRLDTVGLRDS
jgi:putative acetyltransferase